MSGFFCMKPFLLEGIVVLRLFCPTLNKDQSHISIWHIWWDRWTIIHFCPFSFHHHLIHLFQQRRLTPGSVIKPDRPNGMFTNSTELISHTLGPFKKKKKSKQKIGGWLSRFSSVHEWHNQISVKTFYLAWGATQNAWPPLPRAVMFQCVPKPVRRGTKHNQPFVALLFMRKCQIPASTQQDILIYKLAGTSHFCQS